MEDPQPRLPAIGAVTVAAIVLLAGCVTIGYGENEAELPDATPEERGSYELTASEVDTNRPYKVVTLRVTKNTTVDMSFANGGPEAWRDRTWTGCGSIEAAIATQGEVRFDRTHRWSFSNGHAVTWASGGDGSSMEHPAAQENLFLGFDFQETVEDIPVSTGDRIKISLATGAGPETRFDPVVNVTTEHPSLKVAEEARHPFWCGANLGEFSGVLVDLGSSPAAPTIVEDAGFTVGTETGTSAAIGTFLDPRFAGGCTTQILMDGDAVNTSGPRTDACISAFQGGPGRAELKIDRLYANGPKIAYFIGDRPPLFPAS